jgi:hypothetical protein
MSSDQLKTYLERDLANELDWLVRAATEWHAQSHMALDIDGYTVQVYAMDSAFLHARTLFEFFTRKTQDYFYGHDEYGVTNKIKSSLYEKHWSSSLHARLMHAQDRSKSPDVKSFDPAESKKHIKNMPVDFAMEVVRMWRKFACALQTLADEDMQRLGHRAVEILDEAVVTAETVRTNKVTQKQLAQLKKVGRLPKDFGAMIRTCGWPSAW